MTRHELTTRRTALSGIVTGAVVAASGCLSTSENGEPENGEDGLDDDEIFEEISVEGTELVLEFSDEASIDQVNVIDPNGEAFAERSVAAGAGRETIEIGTGYEPGEYDVVALEEGDERTTQSVTIEPDVRITDLRLGRNHPDEMFDGASDREIETEVILTLKNAGNGPDEIRGLVFSGDVPRPTPDDFDESGIYDTDSEVSRYADAIDLLAGEEVTVYSRQMPFYSVDPVVSCSPETTEGEFQVIFETAVQEEPPSETYVVTYTGEDLIECDIDVEVAS